MDGQEAHSGAIDSSHFVMNVFFMENYIIICFRMCCRKFKIKIEVL